MTREKDSVKLKMWSMSMMSGGQSFLSIWEFNIFNSLIMTMKTNHDEKVVMTPFPPSRVRPMFHLELYYPLSWWRTARLLNLEKCSRL